MDQQAMIDLKLELLALAEKLGNVSAACKALGFSRDSYYRIKRAHETGGVSALRLSSKRKANLKNRVATNVEKAVLEISGSFPQWGQERVARELAGSHVHISPFGVRSIWKRHGLATAQQRIEAARILPLHHSKTSLSQGAEAPDNECDVSGSGRPNRVPPSRKRNRNAKALKRRRREGSDTAGVLIRGALDLFASQNYSTVTIKDIADVTDTNASLIYYYFGSKERLFRKVVETTADEAYNTFVAIRNQTETPTEIIALWIRNHFLQFSLMQKLIKISIDYANTQDHSPETDKAIHRFYDIESEVLGRAIRLGVQQGIFVPVNVDQTIAFISTFLDGVLARSVMMEDFDAQQAIETLVHFITKWLQSPREETILFS